MTVSSDRFAVLLRVMAGDAAAKQRAADILLRGLVAWMEADGRIPLERCCGLPPPSARRAFNLARRDLWLCNAHRLCSGNSHWARSRALHVELNRFKAAIWPRWRGEAAPPPGASALRTALFHAMRYAEQLAGDDGQPAIPGTARGLDFAVKGIGAASSQPQSEDEASDSGFTP